MNKIVWLLLLMVFIVGCAQIEDIPEPNEEEIQETAEEIPEQSSWRQYFRFFMVS